MKYAYFSLLLLFLYSCGPASKTEALDYYVDVKFETANDVIMRMDKQMIALQQYMGTPDALRTGPTAEDHKALLKEQKEIITSLNETIDQLEKIESIGDEAEFLETLTAYMKKRVNYEENTILRIIELLEGGMTPEEAKFLTSRTSELKSIQYGKKNLIEVEGKFLKEFGISESDIKAKLKK